MAVVVALNYRPKVAFSLALLTAVMWGVLPVFLKLCLLYLDAVTITSVRFLSAGIILLPMMFMRHELKVLHKSPYRLLMLCLLATLMLAGNYVATVQGLVYLSPESVQVLMQVAPLLLMLGGVVIFRESFSHLQLVGAAILTIGLMLFFHQRLPQIASSDQEQPIGIAIVVGAGACWAIYALIQKPLLQHFSARQLTFIIYIVGGLILIPWTSPLGIFDLPLLQVLALIFCCLNTLIAYGAFTYALGIWEASKVGAVVATAPLFTFLATAVAIRVWPDVFVVTELDWLAYLGAGCVVLGSMTASLGRKPR
ncbi:DMT family transporter [Alteromonas sp. ASW11-36]|uniref:DMT family transporter n=1 Tax=Alteromonas arenosi TaxID=3055817 RepID=A0ABT7SXT9_9ALTE|nr:DMT family transporter [Alteromonas sp. ASW11-36]MDM7861010.1 DMT family transporter [Alteromonas sp. ASW11-36]